MSVTKYVFDFNTYVITNMGNSDKLKSAVPSNVTHADQILDAVVATKNSENKSITSELKQKIAAMLYPLLAEKVYNNIFGKVQTNSATMKNIMSFDNRDNEESDFRPSISGYSTQSTTPSTTPRSTSEIDLNNNNNNNIN